MSEHKTRKIVEADEFDTIKSLADDPASLIIVSNPSMGFDVVFRKHGRIFMGAAGRQLWYVDDPRVTESGIVSLALCHTTEDDPIWIWTLSKDEFMKTDPERLQQAVPLGITQKYEVDLPDLEKQLAKTQLDFVKPWRKLTEKEQQRRESRIYFDADDKFIPKRLADELIETWGFQTMMDTKEIYMYNGVLWTPRGESFIHAECQKRLGDQTTTHHISEVQNYVRGETYVERAIFNSNVNLLNLENGVYDVENGELRDHAPTYLFTQNLPLTYDPEAKCPNIEQFLEQIQPNKNDRQGMIQLVGYCLHRAYPLHRAWMFCGSGANGKSTFLNLMKAFLGVANIVSVSLHELEENRFSKASLYDKHANLYPDLPSRALYQTGSFKMVTGSDPLTGEKKFRDPFNFVNFAKMVFSANQVPRVSDDTDAFYRRWIIINFPIKFEGDKADTRILDKLTTPKELSGLLNLALKALKDLLVRGQFSNDQDTDIKREQYIRLSDPVRTFVMDMVDSNPDAFISKDLLYAEFAQFCRDNNYPTVAKVTFDKRLRAEAPVQDYRPEVNGARIQAWKGVTLRSEEDREPAQRRLD